MRLKIGDTFKVFDGGPSSETRFATYEITEITYPRNMLKFKAKWLSGIWGSEGSIIEMEIPKDDSENMKSLFEFGEYISEKI